MLCLIYIRKILLVLVWLILLVKAEKIAGMIAVILIV
jgi:hypothetical protein